MQKNLNVAFLIPCFNEETTISELVKNCKETFAEATVYVFDNNSTDKTTTLAEQAGAIIRRESRQGKGNVVRRMFADIEADIYILCDGDMTYDIASAPTMVRELIEGNQDMVVATRVSDLTSGQPYPIGHAFGNKVLTNIVGSLFGNYFSDILSGYRVFSRRFVKSFPALSRGFEIETELTIHALELRLPVSEIKTPYYARPVNSESKLSTFKDGGRILMVILFLLKEVRPLLFFGTIFSVLTILSMIISFPIFKTYLETGLVPRFPTAILASGTIILAFLSLSCGAILDSVSRGRRETKRMHYLNIKPLRKD